MQVIDFEPYLRKITRWDMFYLAYQASTPRNWIEAFVEPNTHNPRDRIRVVDVVTRDMVGLPADYPAIDQPMWWTVMCLDGAPERMKHLTDHLKLSPDQATTLVTPAEQCFKHLIANATLSLPAPAAQIFGKFRDGAIIGYKLQQAACQLVTEIARACDHMNTAKHLPWNHQFHVRAGIGESLRDAFSGLLSTRRDEMNCLTRIPRDPGWEYQRNKTSLTPQLQEAR